MAARIVSQDATTITLGWTRPAGQWGFVPMIDGSEILTDGKRHIGKSATKTTVRIGKPRDGVKHSYDVVVLTGAKQGAVTGTAAPPLPGPVPLPPPAPGADNSLAQSWIVLGQDPMTALKDDRGQTSPGYYKLAATADMGYRGFYDAAFFAEVARQQRVLVPWCDCRPAPGGTPPEVAIQWMHELGAPFWMGQAEWPEEFDAAMGASVKPRVICGDLAHLRQDQRDRVRNREVLFIDEAYRNCSHITDPAWPSWEDVEEGVGGNLHAVYQEGPCTRIAMSELVRLGYFVAHRDSVYGPQMTGADYRAMP